jgi:hypothetical protein
MTDNSKGSNFEVSSVQGWKKSSEAKGLTGKPIPLEVPSGNVALVRPVGLQVFFELGMIPNTLLTIMGTILDKAKGGKKVSEREVNKALEGIQADPERIVDIIRMADAITVHCVIQPQVEPVPERGVERDEDTLYVDEVDLEDKMFIMNFAFGGARDLEPFRTKLTKHVGSVSPVQDLGNSA